MPTPKTILDLCPKQLWKHFYQLTQIPRPTGHMEQITTFIKDFGHQLGLEVKQDGVGNILIIKPASKGMVGKPTVILQSHLDMVPQKSNNKTHDFIKDPIGTIIDNNIVRANETTLGADNGIGVATMMSILEDNNLNHPELECLFTIDEEMGMNGAFGLKSGFLKGSILLNLDTEDEGELTVGCAGGADVNAVFEYKTIKAFAEENAFIITIQNLKGGHSGTDIDKGRANANKLLAYFLKEAIGECDIRLANFNGGSMRNAIPREATAIVSILRENKQLLIDLVKDFEEIFRQEYQDTEPDLSFTIEEVKSPSSLLPQEIQDGLINSLVGVPNGVIKMLTSFKGIVETSTNLAYVETTEGKINVGFLVRSSSENAKDQVCSSIESVFSLAGAKVEVENPYPGWQPNAKSEMADLMKKNYKDLFNKDAHILVVHAGLECGIILDSTPGLDIVSFGPNIFNAHSPTEYVEIDSVERFYTYLLKVLEQI